MNQPTFSDGPPVPMMVEATLDHTLLNQYVLDLRTNARIESIREKGGATDHSSSLEPSLEDVLKRLQAGSIRAVQIRYTHADECWSDTLFAGPGGYKLVRCRHEAG